MGYFSFQKTLTIPYKNIIIFKHLAGVVKRPNTPGCEPGIRQFESGHSPQT